MAFVNMAQRRLGQALYKQQFPSPAHYKLKEQQVSRECAPFRSTSIRKVPFIEQQHTKIPGPGEYNIAKQIIQPRISAYTNEDSIIIKVNSTGTAQFKSSSKRFQYQNKNLSLQPEQAPNYFSVPKQKRKHPKNPINKTLIPPIKPTRPSIPTKVQALLNPESKEIIKLYEAEPGPGNYEIGLREKIISKGTVWGKDKIKRFRDDILDNTGPGAYNVAINMANPKSPQKSSNFNSGTVRTFFDTIMYNSSSQYIVDRKKKMNFKSPAPAPGQYNPEDSSFVTQEPKPQKFQFFGSSVKRFSNEEADHKITKNATYFIPNFIGPNKSHNKLNPSFNSSSERLPSFLTNGEQVNNPGPGQYKLPKSTIKAKQGKKVQRFGSTVERLPQEPKEIIDQEKELLNENEIQLQNQLLKSRFGQLETQSSIFKSKTNRICFSQTKSIYYHIIDVSLGLDYDLTYNDVSKKAQRQRIHLQNLRRIQVYKPPFEVNTPRFPHYQQWNQPQQKREPSDQKITKNSETKFKPVAGGIIDKSERFRNEKISGVPGAGYYEYNNEWRNKSFNKIFHIQ